ncbi:MAG TPA: DUF5996 family protein [Acidobacteriaceae bacterium]|jgi:hypothetical protein|nr:DUF5996 family protein [Acidobacteriaceae bacterium]
MTATTLSDDAAGWPALPLAEWADTCATLHMWTQIVGKVRLTLTPLVNHWWNVPLYVTARGLTTSRIPYGARAFELRFDFLAHRLVLETSEGAVKTLALEPRTVADFYRECLAMLASEGIDVKIWRMPVEVPNPIAFDEDTVHRAYDAAAVERFWRVLLSVDAAFQDFRAEFIGKVSPVHFFWGSFDLAVTRFSGRRAPERPGADAVTREAYSHEVSSVGFWPGTAGGPDAAFYSYAAPSPEGFSAARARPEAARWDAGMGEFLLAYADVRRSASPSRALLEFCRSTYQAAARFGQWDRGALERLSVAR